MATYALSPTINGHGHTGIHHDHPHSRKPPVPRSPLHSTSSNGGYQMNGGSPTNDLLKPQTLPQHQHHKSADMFHESRQEQTPPSFNLPSPHASFSTPTDGRSKSMERRKIVGLPTHLQLERDGHGYGFPAATTTQRFRASSIGPGERYELRRGIVFR